MPKVGTYVVNETTEYNSAKKKSMPVYSPLDFPWATKTFIFFFFLLKSLWVSSSATDMLRYVFRNKGIVIFLRGRRPKEK